MLSPKLERFLSKQRANLVGLDNAESVLKPNVRPVRNAQGKLMSLNEQMYANSLEWLGSPDGHKALLDEFSYLESLNEETLAAAFPTFTTQYLPLIRRIHARMVATDLVSVQPLIFSGFCEESQLKNRANSRKAKPICRHANLELNFRQLNKRVETLYPASFRMMKESIPE